MLTRFYRCQDYKKPNFCGIRFKDPESGKTLVLIIVPDNFSLPAATF